MDAFGRMRVDRALAAVCCGFLISCVAQTSGPSPSQTEAMRKAIAFVQQVDVTSLPYVGCSVAKHVGVPEARRLVTEGLTIWGEVDLPVGECTLKRTHTESSAFRFVSDVRAKGELTYIEFVVRRNEFIWRELVIVVRDGSVQYVRSRTQDDVRQVELPSEPGRGGGR
jgi:hypothetical protein